MNASDLQVLFDLKLANSPIGQSRIDILNEAFSSSNRAGSLKSAAILLGVIAVVFVITQIVYFCYKRNTTRVIDSPRKLFNELSRAHHIPRKYRKTLHQLARVKGLQDPCCLFVEPSLWEMDSNHDGQLGRPKAAKQLQILHRILFSGDH